MGTFAKSEIFLKEGWGDEVEQAMRHQVAWASLDAGWRHKLLLALWLAGYGVDEAIEFCDELADGCRELLFKNAQAIRAELA